MADSFEKKLTLLRADMSDQDLSAYIVPRADEYLGEYVPPQNERLQWISGFTGSAGAVIVLQESAAIFVDGRYTIQVRQQVPEGLFEFHHLIEEPPIDWLANTLVENTKVGFDPRMISLSQFKSWQKVLNKKNIDLDQCNI